METLRGLTGIEGPVFIRKLTRKSHWGDTNTEQESRLSFALSNMFCDNEGSKFSFYRAESVIELAQMAIGLNSNRGSLKEQIDFVPFSEEELSGLELVQTPGETNCYAANKLHFDVVAKIQLLSDLCKVAMQNNRMAVRLSKNWLEKKLNEPRISNCYAITKIADKCKCD